MQNRLLCCLAIVAVTMLFCGVQQANAQNVPDELSDRQKRRQNAAVMPTPEQQVVIKEFVREHHPELVELLDRLESGRPAIYERAIKDVAKSHGRLMRIQKNTPNRYEAALELWKVRSRIHVASARVAVNDSPEHRDQLRTLVEQQIELRIQQLKSEQQRAEQRMQRVQDQLAKFGEEGDLVREARIEKESKSAINRIRRLGKKKKQNKNQNEKAEAGDGSQ